MQTKGSSVFSALAVPVLGMGVLLAGLYHTGPTAAPKAPETTQVYLLDPSVRMDRSMTIYLRQQAKEVALCRRRLHAAKTAGRPLSASEVLWRRAGLAQAVGDYNLIARECTPAVFRKTGMPPALTL